MIIDESDLRKFARILFQRGYNIGWFTGGDPHKLDKSYKMTLEDIEEGYLSDELRELFKVLKEDS